MKKPIMLAAAAALVLLAAGYVFLLPMVKGKSAEAVDEDEPVAAAKKPRRSTAPGLIYPVPERVVNLAGPPGVPHYARIELALEFAPPKGAKKGGEEAGGHGGGKEPALDPALAPVVARKAQIDDMLLRLISAKSVEQMTSADGKEALKQEILAALEEIVPEPTPVAVYIVRLVVQ
jgi:flagellar basal body-associated protein FliL